MSRRIALVGHCGPDSSYLRIAVGKVGRDVKILSADDSNELQRVLEEGVDLLLLNRELGYGFETDQGVDLIRQLRASHPDLKMMLVTNYPDVQAAAIAAGARPGFGKREIGSPVVLQRLLDALAPAPGTPG